MSLPAPEPGLVMPYAYLWRHEHRKGQEECRKVRPSVIVLAVQSAKGGAPRVTVAPITHTAPAKDGEAVDLPPRVKQALGLDDDRSWIVLDEVNQFAWPGYDIRPVPGSKDRFAYGFIPPRLYDTVIGRILELAAARRATEISRDRAVQREQDRRVVAGSRGGPFRDPGLSRSSRSRRGAPHGPPIQRCRRRLG